MKTYIFFQSCLSYFFVLLFLLLFLRLRKKLLFNIAVSFVSFALYCLLAWGKSEDQLWGWQVLAVTAAQILLTQGIAFYLDAYRDFRTLFTGFSSAAFTMACGVPSSAVYSLTKQVWISMVTLVAVNGLALCILAHFIRAYYHTEQRMRKGGWLKLCVVPAVFYITVNALAVFPANISETPQNWLALVMVLILLVVSYITIFQLLAAQRNQNMLQRNADFLTRESEQLSLRLKMNKEQETNMAMLRHDIRHYLISVSAFCKAGDCGRVREILQEAEAWVQENSDKKFCENVMVNSVAAYYIREAEKKKIRFVAALDVPEKLPVHETEFAAVLGNLLSNALEGAEKTKDGRRREIILRCICGGNLFLEIKNSYDGKAIEFSEETGMPVSQRGEGHGYGMLSVAGFVKKYQAEFSWSAENGMFTVKIFI